MFLKVVLVSGNQIVGIPKKYIWNAKYTIQQSIERSQTTKCMQYNIHDTKLLWIAQVFITANWDCYLLICKLLELTVDLFLFSFLHFVVFVIAI